MCYDVMCFLWRWGASREFGSVRMSQKCNILAGENGSTITFGFTLARDLYVTYGISLHCISI